MLIWLSVFIALSVSLLIFKLSGAILAQFLFSNQNLRQSVFVQVLTGITYLTITFACLKSNFQTIYSPLFFIITSYTLWSTTKNYRFFSKHLLFKNIYRVFVPIIFMSFCYLIFFISRNGHDFVIGHDHAFFGYHSFELSKFGIENRSGIFNSLIDFSEMRHLYHYIDLWLISLISESSYIHNFYVVFLYIPILSISLFYIFICEFYDRIKFKDHIVLLSLMVGTFLCVPFFREVDLLNSTFNLEGNPFGPFQSIFLYLEFFYFISC